MNKKDTTKALTDGLIVTVFEDDGPTNIYNSSPLADDEAFTMAIKTLTAIGTSQPFNPGEIRAYGPIPTPKDPYVSEAFMFSLGAKDSMDNRIAQFGRMIFFWIITTSNSISKYTEFLKLMVKRTLRVYNIVNDKDLYNEDILKKIDDNIRIIDTGIDAYYLTDAETIEAFGNLSMIPDTATILLVSSEKSQIQVIFRDQPTPIVKTKVRRIVDDFKKKMPRGSLFRAEMVTDPMIGKQLLSKSGLEAQADMGLQYRLRLSGKLDFEELDQFLSLPVQKIRGVLAKRILDAFNNKSSLDFTLLASEVGFSEKFIIEVIQSAIQRNIMSGCKIENGLLIFD
ncbi:MAG: hypothetical protein ACW98F_07705 [Candidatus Hodarchaeales archaeon]